MAVRGYVGNLNRIVQNIRYACEMLFSTYVLSATLSMEWVLPVCQRHHFM